MEKKKKKLRVRDVIYIVTTSLLVAGLGFTVTYLLIRKQVDENQSYYDQKVESFMVQNANLSQGQIVFIGDSITDLYKLDDYYADLDKAVYNRGIGGDTTEGVLKRLQVSLYDIAPSKIVLLIGINDMNGKKSNKTIVNNYDKILSDIKAHLPSSMVYPLSITPQNKVVESYAGWINAKNANQTAKEINVEIEQLANKYSYTYLDLHSLLADSEGYLKEDCSEDGIHLNDNGFTIWTNLVKPYLL